jgi:glyoxalase family protein
LIEPPCIARIDPDRLNPNLELVHAAHQVGQGNPDIVRGVPPVRAADIRPGLHQPLLARVHHVRAGVAGVTVNEIEPEAALSMAVPAGLNATESVTATGAVQRITGGMSCVFEPAVELEEQPLSNIAAATANAPKCCMEDTVSLRSRSAGGPGHASARRNFTHINRYGLQFIRAQRQDSTLCDPSLEIYRLSRHRTFVFDISAHPRRPARVQSPRSFFMALNPIRGLHHVTAYASDPQRNLDFYTQVLGLRFVKKTVNFDDPGTYHFYFGDDVGAPGTILTFFPWPHAARGIAGAGETTHTAFSVPEGSLPYWHRRLTAQGVPVEETGSRFEEQVLTFADPDGMKLELVAHAGAGPANGSRFADVEPEHAISGFFGVTLLERALPATAAILNLMGFAQTASEGARVRFESPGDALGRRIDVVVTPNAGYGRPGAGSVHHIAFRNDDDANQLLWRAEIEQHLQVTTVQDRTYFHSIYFREPGGVLFEMATDPPGFALDEPIESLGEALRIPEWLEPRRAMIERRLLPITLHKAGVASGVAP